MTSMSTISKKSSAITPLALTNIAADTVVAAFFADPGQHEEVIRLILGNHQLIKAMAANEKLVDELVDVAPMRRVRELDVPKAYARVLRWTEDWETTTAYDVAICNFPAIFHGFFRDKFDMGQNELVVNEAEDFVEWANLEQVKWSEPSKLSCVNRNAAEELLEGEEIDDDYEDLKDKLYETVIAWGEDFMDDETWGLKMSRKSKREFLPRPAFTIIVGMA